MILDCWESDPLPTPSEEIGDVQDWRRRSAMTLNARTSDTELFCDDCGASDKFGQVWGFTSPITTTGESRIYCDACKRRRGLQHLFDARPWSVIEAAHRKDVA